MDSILLLLKTLPSVIRNHLGNHGVRHVVVGDSEVTSTRFSNADMAVVLAESMDVTQVLVWRRTWRELALGILNRSSRSMAQGSGVSHLSGPPSMPNPIPGPLCVIILEGMLPQEYIAAEDRIYGYQARWARKGVHVYHTISLEGTVKMISRVMEHVERGGARTMGDDVSDEARLQTSLATFENDD